MGYPASGVMARAIAYGTPVICTDHGALADHGDGDGVTVIRDAPEDPDELSAVVADRVRDLVDDRDALALAGRQVQGERRRGSHEAVAAQFRGDVGSPAAGPEVTIGPSPEDEPASDGTRAVATAAKGNLLTTLVAMLWLYGGRGVGMLWTVVLLSQLGVSDYGLYGMAFALSAVIGPPLDNPYVVRSMRESEERFVAERASRFLVGLTLVAAGTALVGVSYIAWFGLTVAGGEIAYKSYSSRFARTARRTASGGSTASVRSSASLSPASTCSVSTIRRCWARVPCTSRPTTSSSCSPGSPPAGTTATPRTAASHARTRRRDAGYSAVPPGRRVLLGFLTDSRTAGYYTLCWTVAAALAAVGQSFGMTYYTSRCACRAGSCRRVRR